MEKSISDVINNSKPSIADSIAKAKPSIQDTINKHTHKTISIVVSTVQKELSNKNN